MASCKFTTSLAVPAPPWCLFRGKLCLNLDEGHSLPHLFLGYFPLALRLLLGFWWVLLRRVSVSAHKWLKAICHCKAYEGGDRQADSGLLESPQCWEEISTVSFTGNRRDRVPDQCALGPHVCVIVASINALLIFKRLSPSIHRHTASHICFRKWHN